MEFKLEHDDNFSISVLQDLAGTLPSGTADGRLIETEIWKNTLLPFFRGADRIGADFLVRGETTYSDVKLCIYVSHEGAPTILVRLWARTADGKWELSDPEKFRTSSEVFLSSASFAGKFVKTMNDFAKTFDESAG